jgi:hypothetical protein
MTSQFYVKAIWREGIGVTSHRSATHGVSALVVLVPSVSLASIKEA